MVICWERADILALVYDVLLSRCHFPTGILGQVWCFIVLIPDLCPFSYFNLHKIRLKGFAKHFQNFIDDTMIRFLNSKLDLNSSCAKDFQNLISMVTWCIN